MNFSFLDGYKTYIISALMVLLVAVTKLFGWEIPGVAVGDDWLTYIMGALGLGTLRAGVAKSGPS